MNIGKYSVSIFALLLSVSILAPLRGADMFIGTGASTITRACADNLPVGMNPATKLALAVAAGAGVYTLVKKVSEINELRLSYARLEAVNEHNREVFDKEAERVKEKIKREEAVKALNLEDKLKQIGIEREQLIRNIKKLKKALKPIRERNYGFDSLEAASLVEVTPDSQDSLPNVSSTSSSHQPHGANFLNARKWILNVPIDTELLDRPLVCDLRGGGVSISSSSNVPNVSSIHMGSASSLSSSSSTSLPSVRK